MGGISRVHGGLVTPKNFAGVNLQDFTLTFWVGDAAAVWDDYVSNGIVSIGGNYGSLGTSPGGALDQIFRNATGNIGTVSRVGMLQSTSSAATLRFAVEVLGADYLSTGTLGTGSAEDTTYSYGSIALALQGRIQEVGSVTVNVGKVVHCSSATVAAFVY
jgi:hypothetical protein